MTSEDWRSSIRYRTALKELVKVDDEIVGAVLTTPTGEHRPARAQGSGAGDRRDRLERELRERLAPRERAASTRSSPDSNTGDGILAGERVSGEIDSELEQPGVVDAELGDETARRPSLGVSAHHAGSRQAGIAGRRQGRRTFRQRGEFRITTSSRACSGRTVLPASVPSYLVCDRSFISDYGIGLVHPGTRDLRRFIDASYLFEGGTIEELAAKIGVDGDALTRTIERYNQYAETGVDEEFGRGTSELNRFNGDPASKPNPCLRKIGPGPYYAVAVWPSDLASSAGLRIGLPWTGAAIGRRRSSRDSMLSVRMPPRSSVEHIRDRER